MTYRISRSLGHSLEATEKIVLEEMRFLPISRQKVNDLNRLLVALVRLQSAEMNARGAYAVSEKSDCQ